MMKLTGAQKCFKIMLMAIMALGIISIYFNAAYCSNGETHSSGADKGHSSAVHKGWVKTDTYRVMNFAVLAIGLIFLLRKPVSEALSSRIKDIKKQLDELDTQKREAEKQLAEYENRLSTLEKEAEKIVSDYVRQGNEARIRILEDAKMAAEKLELKAKYNIDYEFSRAKKRLEEEIFEKALTKAEEIIKSRLSSEDQEKLIDDYLEKVVA